jgi:glycosyltransferase involved in cell wall biosynthesis
MTIVPVSRWLCEIVKQSYLAKYTIQIINNGIDIETFSPQDRTIELREKFGIGNRFMILGVATVWSPRKGLDDYIKLSELLSDDYILILVGLSTAQLKTLPKKIIGLPHTENILELTKLYSAADVVLNLSAEETFGLTTVEGFACGTPGIVYNCTASPELINPETGLIVEAGNLKQLTSAIEQIKSNGKDYYSLNCRRRAELYYNKKDRYNEYIKLYNNLLKSSNHVHI